MTTETREPIDDVGETVTMSAEERGREHQDNVRERLTQVASDALDLIIKELKALMSLSTSIELRRIVSATENSNRRTMLLLGLDQIDEEEGRIDRATSLATLPDAGNGVVTKSPEVVLNEIVTLINAISNQAPRSKEEATPDEILQKYKTVILAALRRRVTSDQIRAKYSGDVLRVDRDVRRVLDEVLKEKANDSPTV